MVPPVQKSWSSGSTGKRKAEDVEVDPGSTTPPKEQKEHRATFAPEPRSMSFTFFLEGIILMTGS